jgi:hypothetical protein
MKEIRWSDHARLKLEVLANHDLNVSAEFVVEAIRSPDKIEAGEEG